MSRPSDWPLSPNAIRYLISQDNVDLLARHPMCCDLYPLSMGYYPEAKGHRMARDRHDDNLIIYCADGRGVIVIGDQRHSVGEGDIMVLPKGMVHRYHSLADKPWTIFWVHFQGNLAGDYIDNIHLDEKSPIKHIGLVPQLIHDFERLMTVRVSEFTQAKGIQAACNLRQLLAYIGVLTQQTHEPNRASLDLEQIHAFMQRHIHQQITLDELATQFNLSKYYFSKRYKLLTGHTPIQQFIRFKMEHACYLLDISQWSISAVAAELGYDDSYYFSRLFTKSVGVSPSRYRQLRR